MIFFLHGDIFQFSCSQKEDKLIKISVFCKNSKYTKFSWTIYSFKYYCVGRGRNEQTIGIPNASLSGFNQYWWVQKEEKRLNVVLFAFDPLSKELHRDRANVVLAHWLKWAPTKKPCLNRFFFEKLQYLIKIIMTNTVTKKASKWCNTLIV